MPLVDESLTHPLTEHQLHIVRLLSEGKTNQDIADVMGRSERTISNQVATIYMKTRATNRVALARWYVDNYLLTKPAQEVA